MLETSAGSRSLCGSMIMPYMMDTVCTCLYGVNTLCNFELRTEVNFHCIVLAVIVLLEQKKERRAVNRTETLTVILYCLSFL